MSRLLNGYTRLCSLTRTNGRVCSGWVPPCNAVFRDVLSLPFQVHGVKTDPSSETEERVVGNERVRRICEEIVSLNLLEIADLTELLHKRLRTPPGMMGMQMGMPQFGQQFPTQPPAAAAAPAAEAPKAAEKTEFSVKLASFDAASKIKVIKEVRAVTNLGLKEAKELVSVKFARWNFDLGCWIEWRHLPACLPPCGELDGSFGGKGSMVLACMRQINAWCHVGRCNLDGPFLWRFLDPSILL